MSASLGAAFFASALAESEAEAATADTERRRVAAQGTSWLEEALSVLGPYGVLESSAIAPQTNFLVGDWNGHLELSLVWATTGVLAGGFFVADFEFPEGTYFGCPRPPS